MLAVKRLRGFAPEVNLRNPLRAGEKAQKWNIHPTLKPSIDVTGSPKQGYQWPHKKDLIPSKTFVKKFKNMFQRSYLTNNELCVIIISIRKKFVCSIDIF